MLYSLNKGTCILFCVLVFPTQVTRVCCELKMCSGKFCSAIIGLSKEL